jgi:hypothetical protein
MSTEQSPNHELTILLLDIPDSPVVTPALNYIGSSLLVKLVEARLTLAQLSTGEPNFSGPLNHGLCHFHGTSPFEVSQEILKVLNELELAAWARIYRFDPAEGIVRCLHPRNGQDIQLHDLEAFADRNRTEQNGVKRLLEAARDEIARDGKPE